MLCLVVLRRVSLGRFRYLTGISPRHSPELSEMPAIRQCKLSFHLFPYFRCPRTAPKTRPSGRGDVCTRETRPNKKCWGQKWELNLSLSSGSPWQRPLPSGSHPPAHGSFCWAHAGHASLRNRTGFKLSFLQHTVVIMEALHIHAVIKPLIQHAGDLALFPPTVQGDASSHTLLPGAWACSLMVMLAGTGEQGDSPLSCQAHIAPQKCTQGPLGQRQRPRAPAGEGWFSAADPAHRTASCTCFTDSYRADPWEDFTSKTYNSWLPGEVRCGLVRKAEAFLVTRKAWSVSIWRQLR